MFALDFDGVVADTNQAVSQWVREHVGLEIPRYRCDLTQLRPVIGAETHEELCREVYGEESTRRLKPFPGAEAALPRLAEAGPVFLITARNPDQTECAVEWLKRRGWLKWFAEVVCMGDRRKVDLAAERGCAAHIDDDQRHLIPGVIPSLILFRGGMGEPPRQLDGCTVCCSWDDALACALAAVE